MCSMKSRLAGEDGKFTSREAEAEALVSEQGGGSWGGAGLRPGRQRGPGQRLPKAMEGHDFPWHFRRREREAGQGLPAGKEPHTRDTNMPGSLRAPGDVSVLAALLRRL